MKYVLECQCGSQDFEYDAVEFTCTNCGHVYHEDSAGKHLISEEE